MKEEVASMAAAMSKLPSESADKAGVLVGLDHHKPAIRELGLEPVARGLKLRDTVGAGGVYQ